MRSGCTVSTSLGRVLLLFTMLLLVSCGGGGGGGGTMVDTTPNAFSFAAQTGVSFNTVVTSNTITVTGINADVSISISGGEYTLNGGAYTSAGGTLSNNSTVALQVTSGASFGQTTSVTVTIGGVSATFDVTTLQKDTTPDAFTIANKADVPLNSLVTSAPVTITGINSPAAVSITGGVYSIDGASYTSTAGTVSNGQTITLQLQSSSKYGTSATATLTVDSVSANFVVTTIADTVPPTATIVFPPFDNTVTLYASSIVVRGTATDNDAVSKVTVNGVTASTTNNYATWQATVNLTTNSSNAITVAATDASGNVNSTAATVNVVAKNGYRVCADFGYDSAANTVYGLAPLSKFDLSTNNQQVLVPFSAMTFQAIVYDAASGRLFGLSSGAIYEVDTTSGATSTISPQGTDGVTINSASHLELDAASGVVYLEDQTDLRVISVNLTTGARVVISDNTDAGPQYDLQSLLAFSAGRLFASTGNLNNAPVVMEVDLTTGAKTVISNKGTGNGQNFVDIFGLGVDVSAGKAYVADMSGDLLSVDLASGDRTVVSESDNYVASGFVWEQGLEMNLDVANHRALVYECGSGQLFSVDLANGSRTLLTTPYRGSGPALIPRNVALDPNNGRLFTVDAGGVVMGSSTVTPLSKIRSVISVDPTTGDRTVVSNDAVGSGTAIGSLFDLAYDSANDRILALDNGNKALVSINPLNGLRTDLSDNVTKGTGPTFNYPFGVAVTSDGTTAYVADPGTKSLISVDLASGNRTTVSDNSGVGSGPTFSAPVGVVLTADNATAYVANQANGSIYSVDLASGDRTVVASSSVGSGTAPVEPTLLALDTVNNRLFVVDYLLDGILVVNLKDGSRTRMLPAGIDAHHADDITYDASSGLLYAVQGLTNSIYIFDPSTSAAVIVSE